MKMNTIATILGTPFLLRHFFSGTSPAFPLGVVEYGVANAEDPRSHLARNRLLLRMSRADSTVGGKRKPA